MTSSWERSLFRFGTSKLIEPATISSADGSTEKGKPHEHRGLTAIHSLSVSPRPPLGGKGQKKPATELDCVHFRDGRSQILPVRGVTVKCQGCPEPLRISLPVAGSLSPVSAPAAS